MATVEERKQKIDALTDREALAVFRELIEATTGTDQPTRKEEEAEALHVALGSQGEAFDLSRLAQSAESVPASTARSLLLVMAAAPAQVPPGQRNIGRELDELLDNPPTAAPGAIPLILAAPMVLTGCILALQAAAHVRFKRDGSGRWEVSYDPTIKGPLDNIMKDVVKTLAGVMKFIGV
jgi:hypothetical protein